MTGDHGMSTGYDYGNARLAGLRSRLPDAGLLRRLGHAAGPAELLVLLMQEPDWRSLGRSPGEPVPGGRAAVDDLVDRWRATRLGALLGYYEPPVRRLVEALVLPLDAERLVALLRRRRAGHPVEAIARTLSRGALLDEATLARLAGLPTDAALLRALGPTGVVSEGAAAALGASAVAAASAATPEERAAATEAALRAAIERWGGGRAGGGGGGRGGGGPAPPAAVVRALLAAEAADRDAVAAELAAAGPASAAVLERAMCLSRWAALDRRAHRDPLGIGPVAAYVAAVELAAIRLRAVGARIAGAWREEDASRFLAAVAGA